MPRSARPTPDNTVLGVLMLDTSFPRLIGDIGNPGSFDHPVIYRRIPGAMVSRIVSDQPLPDELVAHFIEQARALEHDGATVITTSCGFLFPLQSCLQAAVSVPVVTSALCLLPTLRQQAGRNRPIGILTFDAARLVAHQIPDDGPFVVEGLTPGDHLYRVIADDLPELDQAKASNNVIDALERLAARDSNLQAVVLECTNLPPYRNNMLKLKQLSFFDIHDAIYHLQNERKI